MAARFPTISMDRPPSLGTKSIRSMSFRRAVTASCLQSGLFRRARKS